MTHPWPGPARPPPRPPEPACPADTSLKAAGLEALAILGAAALLGAVLLLIGHVGRTGP